MKKYKLLYFVSEDEYFITHKINQAKTAFKFFDEIKITQQKILNDYSKMVKINGKLVYATCSILKSENNQQIEKFLKSESGQNFKFEKENNIYSHKTGFDGFYMALLKRIK